VMDPELLHLQTPEATARCPTRAIVWLEEGQFVSDPETEINSSERLRFDTPNVVSKVKAAR